MLPSYPACEVTLDGDSDAMKPLRGFLRYMMNNYPFEGGDNAPTCKTDFGCLHILVNGSQNPSSVVRAVSEVKAACKQKQSPRALLATFGAIPQGRRLLDQADSQAQCTLENLKHIGQLDDVAGKAKQLSSAVVKVIGDSAGLSRVIGAAIALLDSFVSAQKACVAAASDQVVDTQENQSYSTTVSEAQEALSDLIRGCAAKHVMIECRPWLQNQVTSLKDMGTMSELPEFKITCMENVNLKRLGCALQEIPDLMAFYTASRELTKNLQTLTTVLTMAGDTVEQERSAATNVCGCVQRWISAEKALTVSFRDLHTLTNEVKDLIITSVTRLCVTAWGKIMSRPSSLLVRIMEVGWGKPSLDLENSDLTAAVDACSDACLLSTGFRCAADPGCGEADTSGQDKNLCNAAKFVKCVLEAAGSMCDSAADNKDPMQSYVQRAQAMKLVRTGLATVGIISIESDCMEASTAPDTHVE